MEPGSLVIPSRSRIRTPLAARQHPLFLVILDLLPTVLAHIRGFVRLALRPPDLRELQNLELAADRARHPVLPPVALLEYRLDPTHAGDLRRRDHEDLPARERPRAGERQVDRIAFAVYIARITVYLIEEQ